MAQNHLCLGSNMHHRVTPIEILRISSRCGEQLDRLIVRELSLSLSSGEVIYWNTDAPQRALLGFVTVLPPFFLYPAIYIYIFSRAILLARLTLGTLMMSMFGRVAAEFGVRRSTLLFNSASSRLFRIIFPFKMAEITANNRFERGSIRFFLSLFSGLLCHLDDACTSNPCHEGAICDTSPINGSFACSCATGYKGVDCSNDIDECEQGELMK